MLATGYLAFRDDISARFNARQAEIQYTYGERIVALRAKLDRVSSQRLLEQDGIEARLVDVSKRQSQLEQRHATFVRLAERAGTPKLAGVATRELADAPALGLRREVDAYVPVAPKPRPLEDILRLRHDDAPLREQPSPDPTVEAEPMRRSALSPREHLARLDASLQSLEQGQVQALHDLFHHTRHQETGLRLAVSETGLDPDSIELKPGRAGTGGPFVPMRLEAVPQDFEAAAALVEQSLHRLDRLKEATSALPLRRPASGEADLTSSFGVRLDPFTRTPAMHTGLDFRAEAGAAVRAAGGGRVTSADYSGGYGNMIEIDHGNGVSTRYAHLSSINVVAGQEVAAGAVIGRVGSTGRSTGAHLHYETRVDGEPVNPQRFLRAGAKLAATLR